jgi:2-dehydropantoate 2-reductase
MRFVVHGAGGIGGVIAARLHQSGHDVIGIARGAHLDTWRTHGLRLQTPDEDVVVSVPVVGEPAEMLFKDDDVVILAMKSQDTAAALEDLKRAAPETIAIVCAQNGVTNEREATRSFERVYGICVMCPTSFVSPGVVQAHSAPITGIMDIGRYPNGVDDTAEAVAAALRASRFESNAVPDIMRWKYSKLLSNLANSVEAVCAPEGSGELRRLVREEGIAVLTAAGIPFASEEEDRARRGTIMTMRPINGEMRGGGSTWQSLARGTPVETDFLNGEIVRIGTVHGVPTPANTLLRNLAFDAARSGKQPGFMSASQVLSQLRA